MVIAYVAGAVIFTFLSALLLAEGGNGFFPSVAVSMLIGVCWPIVVPATLLTVLAVKIRSRLEQ